MAYETLLLEQQQAVLTITVNRPEVLNAQSRIMREEFDDALAMAAEDDTVRVVIVAGAGQHFSAGHDIGSPQEREDRQRRPYPPGLAGEYKRGWDMNVANTLRWRDFPKPTIAQVQGYCIMGGLILATACDLIVAADDAKFLRPHGALAWGACAICQLALGNRFPQGQGIPVHRRLDCRCGRPTSGAGQPGCAAGATRRRNHGVGSAHCPAGSFALRLAKFSLNQMQDEMGFRAAITGAFQSYSLSVAHRRELGQDMLGGAERARQRDAAFGDNR